MFQKVRDRAKGDKDLRLVLLACDTMYSSLCVLEKSIREIGFDGSADLIKKVIISVNMIDESVE